MWIVLVSKSRRRWAPRPGSGSGHGQRAPPAGRKGHDRPSPTSEEGWELCLQHGPAAVKEPSQSPCRPTGKQPPLGAAAHRFHNTAKNALHICSCSKEKKFRNQNLTSIRDKGLYIKAEVKWVVLYGHPKQSDNKETWCGLCHLGT